MKKLLIWAVVLRVLVSIFYFHPDIKTFNFQTSFLRKGVFNIYSYLVNNKSSLPLKEEFVYFPLTYFTLGGYQAVIAPLLGNGFDSWLANADSIGYVSDPNIFKYLLALKLPYLILDVVIAYTLMNFFEDEKKKKYAFTLWLFNPFSIILIYVFGNIDIFPVALTVLSLLYAKKNKFSTSALMLGLAAGFKIYPLLFAPFLALFGKNLKEKIWIGIIPFLIFGAISLPFISTAFIQSTLISGLTTRIFSPSFSVGFGESIIVGIVAMVGLFCYAAIFNKKPDLIKYWIILFAAIFSFSHFHVQWLLWIAPFLTILAVEEKEIAWLIFIIFASAISIPVFYQDRFMSIDLLRIYSLYFDMLPTPFTVLQKVYDPYGFQSILHSVMAGGTIVLSYKLLKEQK